MTAEEKGKAPPAATPKPKSATQPTQSHPKGSEREINGHSVYRNAWLLTYLAIAHPEAYNNALAQYQEHAVSQLIASGLECETCRQPTEGAYGKDRNQCLDCNIETAVLAKRKTEEMTTTMPPTQTEENATNEENRPAEAIKSRYYICALREDLYDWMIEEMGWATPSQRAQEPETDTVAVTPPAMTCPKCGKQARTFWIQDPCTDDMDFMLEHCAVACEYCHPYVPEEVEVPPELRHLEKASQLPPK